MPGCEKYLDEYFLGSFGQEDYEFYIHKAYEEIAENSYLYIFESIVDDRGQNRAQHLYGYVILVPETFGVQANARWMLSLQAPALLREKLIRCAVFYSRTRQPSLGEPFKVQTQDLLKKARAITRSHLQKCEKEQKRAMTFSVSSFQSEATVESVLPKNTRQAGSGTILKRIKALRPMDEPLSSSYLRNLSKLGVLIETSGSQDTILSPLLLTQNESGGFRPRQLTPTLLREIERSGLPDGLGSLLRAHSQLYSEQDWRRLKKDQWTALCDRYLRDCFHSLDPSTLFFKKDRKKIPIESLVPTELRVSFQAHRKMDTVRVQFHMKSSDDFEGFYQIRIPRFRTDQAYHFLFVQESSVKKMEIPITEDLQKWIEFLDEGSLIPYSALKELTTSIKKLSIPMLELDARVKPLHRVKLTPIPALRFLADKASPSILLDLSFDYDTPRKELLLERELDGAMEIIPFREFEDSAREFFLNKGPQCMNSTESAMNGSRYSYECTRNAFLDWLDQSAQQFLDRGFEIYSIRKEKHLRSAGSHKLEFGVVKKRGWFRLTPKLKKAGKAEIEIEDVDLDEGFLRDKEGNLHRLKEKELQKLKEFLALSKNQVELMIPEESFLLISRWIMAGKEPRPGFLDDSFAKVRQCDELMKGSEIPIPILEGIKLRPYQEIGFQWLHALSKKGLHGCLADDMGLGKTLQALALLKSYQDAKNLKTSLVIAPLSAVTHWIQESRRHVPTLRVLLHQGMNRPTSPREWRQYDLVVTTYGTLLQDQSLFQTAKFQFLILDEAQQIKQSRTQRAKIVKKIKARQRIALSGTPVENRTLELWSLMDFLMPRYLGSRTWFQRIFATPIERGKVPEVRDMLRQLIAPFILRRKKEEVEQELPERIEIEVPISMAADQEVAYARTAQFFKSRIRKQILATGLSRSGPLVLEGLLRLRQVCTLPSAANPEMKQVTSAKFDFLEQRIPEIVDENHRVLIFSQFTTVLDEISELMTDLNIPFVSLRGSHSLKQRDKAVSSFQALSGPPVFLISLKAGGTGLNLTAADYVIIMEPWWNPAVEAQAIDRAHRIGQTRPVMVYRLIAKDTVEEKMMKIHAEKQTLFKELIDQGRSLFETAGEEEILAFFDNDEDAYVGTGETLDSTQTAMRAREMDTDS
jgi:SNF2 family DNA or RNA helicase